MRIKMFIKSIKVVERWLNKEYFLSLERREQEGRIRAEGEKVKPARKVCLFNICHQGRIGRTHPRGTGCEMGLEICEMLVRERQDGGLRKRRGEGWAG